MNYGVVGYDGNELMAVISGYDLNISFNMKLINSLADAEAYATVWQTCSIRHLWNN